LSRVSSSPIQDVRRGIPWNQLYVGLGFTTLATLILELALTRIFSVVFYYHFAFLAISIALFGLGAGGVFSYVVAERPGSLYAKLGALGLSASASVIAALLFILFATAQLGYFTLAVVYIASALPFFFAGAVVSLVIGEAMQRVDRAYFWDLAGAAGGCLLLIPFLHYFGGPNTVISAAVLYLVSSAIWFHQAAVSGGVGVRRRATSVLLALLLVMLMVVNGKTHLIDVRASKGRRLPPEVFTAWNSFSRIGVTGAPGDWTIVIDGDATTGISPYDWDRGITPQQRWKLLHEGPGFPYILRPAAKTLVIGAGGGYDVARALAGGSRDITAVEINPIIATTIMRERFAADSHRIYFLPEVHVAPPQDGRAFVRGSNEKFQVIQATLVDTWASTAAGAFALSENNLYTSDAFYDYLTHLTPDGLLSFTRWGFDPPRESLRLVSLAMDAFARLGETDPAARHVIAVRSNSSAIKGWGAVDTVLISREPFTSQDIERARTASSEAGMEVVYAPGERPVNAFGQLLTASDPQAFFRDYPYNVAPVSDDRPFFFYTVQPRDLWNFVLYAGTLNADYKVNRAVPLLFAVMAISIAATLLVLLLPRWLLGARFLEQDAKQNGVIAFLSYFLCLGAGYILIQVALIQRFILLLGHPEYALTVIVFSMLVSSGLGSYTSRKVIGGKDGTLILVLAAIAALVAVLAMAAGPLVAVAAAWPLPAKVALTAISIAPAAFLMGMPFPSGLRRLEQRHAPSVRWAWSINSASSVLGSAGAIFLAIYLGVRATLLIGGGMYICALAVIVATGRRATASESD
jgi:hypothetical protein